MRSLDVYSTDADPQHVYTLGESKKPVDNWIDQLARISTAPVDLFMNTQTERIIWTFKAREGKASRVNRYLADYRHEPGDSEDIFAGLYTALTDLSSRGTWTFDDDQEERWTAGFNLVRTEGKCPGLNKQEVDALATLLSEDTEQLVVGMSSYSAALQAVKDLTKRGIDGTIAVNSEGATAETEGIDIVFWPGGDRDFQPIDAATKELLSRTGVRRSTNMTVADHTPSESVTTVQGRYDDESPVETFVGDTIGRIGTLFTIVVGAATVGALGNVGPVHPLSGISTLGGLAGALTGLFVVQGSFMLTRGGIDNLFSGGDTDGYASAKKSVLSADGWNWQQYGAYSGYWLTLAYGFPTIYRLRDWPYGATIDLAGTLPSAYRYVVVLFAISLAVYTLWTVRSDRDTDHLTNIGSVAFIHVIFGAGLIFSAGYACSVWYNLIGFATAAC